MSIYFYNTLSRHKDEFTPLNGSNVSLYTCGPTVYNTPHIGNWIAYIRWDTLVRTLKLGGFEVERVMNITDVGHLTGENAGDADQGEDKLEKGARREGITAWEVAKRYTSEFLEGMEALNLLMPEHITKATEFIDAQLDLVRTLKNKGYTYQISDGIYFDTTKFPDYATFARLNLDALKAGARVEMNNEKRHASDFALWKFTAPGQKRDMQWQTPADLTIDGKARPGFPGWHLECSAMAMQYLGETIDIHTGGIDHIPVHHTNEIAQSEAATGKPFARYWLHNAHLLANGTKISKSLGNGYTLADIARKGFSMMDFRMFVLQSHYRTESNFTWENMSAAKLRLQRWKNVANLRWQVKDSAEYNDNQPMIEANVRLLATIQDITNALADDMDTPGALKSTDEAFAKLEASVLSEAHETAFKKLLTVMDDVLGLQLMNTTPDIPAEAKQLLMKRITARDKEAWQTSDKLRDELAAQLIGVRDTAMGSVWYRL